MRARSLKLLVVATVIATSGCVAPQIQTTPLGAATFQIWVSDRLVSESDWEEFLSEVITPRFPEGLSVWRAQGQWRDASLIIQREDSFILDLIHPDDAKSEQSVRDIMTAYKTRFKQEAVLRVRDSVRGTHRGHETRKRPFQAAYDSAVAKPPRRIQPGTIWKRRRPLIL